MINAIKQHLLDNNGDENTSKMIWIAIVFVVGAILLLLITTAFKEPIQEWYDNVVAEWFTEDNGQYSYDEWTKYERNENGTYKDLKYVFYKDDGSYFVLESNYVKEFDDSKNFNTCFIRDYDANGKSGFGVHARGATSISPDGKSIVFDGDVYYAQLP